MNLIAALVHAPVQIFLLGLGDVAVIPGLLTVQAVLLTGQLGIVTRALSRIDLAVRNALVNGSFLIVDVLLGFA